MEEQYTPTAGAETFPTPPMNPGQRPRTEFGRELADIVDCLRGLGATEEGVRSAVLVRLGAKLDLISELFLSRKV